MSSGIILQQRPCISFSSPLLLILRREITAAAVTLYLSEQGKFFFFNLAVIEEDYFNILLSIRIFNLMDYQISFPLKFYISCDQEKQILSHVLKSDLFDCK